MPDENNRNVYTETIADIGLPSDSYFSRSSRPIYSLIYLLPLIAIYEILILAINPKLLSDPSSSIRGGVVSFVWIQNIFQYIGMDTRSSWLAAPLVVVLILLVLQFTSRLSWKIFWPDFLPMIGESIFLAVPLLVLALVLNRTAFTQPSSQAFVEEPVAYCQSTVNNTPATAAVGNSQIQPALRNPIVMDIVTGIGAGIYEELVFRLILISGFMLFFETILGVDRTKAVIISILLSAILFSLHHHIIFMNGHLVRKEVFTISRFTFRAIAGVYFAVIFAVRGFGIAAGAHAFYDIIAVLLNAFFFD